MPRDGRHHRRRHRHCDRACAHHLAFDHHHWLRNQQQRPKVDLSIRSDPLLLASAGMAYPDRVSRGLLSTARYPQVRARAKAHPETLERVDLESRHRLPRDRPRSITCGEVREWRFVVSIGEARLAPSTQHGLCRRRTRRLATHLLDEAAIAPGARWMRSP